MFKFSNLLRILAVLLITTSTAYAGGPFYFMGDGKIRIGRGYKGGVRQISFRKPDGTYIEKGLKDINNLYGADWAIPELRMSLRLIELLDYLEDYFKGKGVRIISGYRDPAYNQRLRDQGKLAASSSQHLDAEAIDIVMLGVPSSTLNKYLIPQNCCGVGYYHGKAIHIDTGPPRFWDETTSGTEKVEPPENEHITIKTKSDVYEMDHRVGLKFSRVTDYPIGVEKNMEFICQDDGRTIKKRLSPQFKSTVNALGKECYRLTNRKEGRTIIAAIPPLNRPRGSGIKCRIRAYFCEPVTAKMPEYVESNEFVLRPPH